MDDWLTTLIVQAGLIGVFVLMLGETVFPPIPSEVIMPLAGFYAAQGELSPIGIVIAGTAGAMVGNTVWYFLARAWGEERFKRWTARHGRWTTIDPEEVTRAHHWFDRHGRAAVGFGRMIPTVRSIISIPAGLACMPIAPFLIFSAVGTTLWTTALAGAGYLLGDQFAEVERYLNPVSTAIIALILGLYVYRLVTHGKRGRENA